MKSTAFTCPGCGQVVNPLGQYGPGFRISSVNNDLVLHQGQDGKWHGCCSRNPLRGFPPAFTNHVED
jgi:hypothetical protein